jgi:hypothetical protein
MAENDAFLDDAEDDYKTIEFIKNYLPQELKDKFTDEQLYYFIDVIAEYYSESGCLDAEPDKEGYVEIDENKVAEYVASHAKKDGIGEFDIEELYFVIDGEMEYGNTVGEE